MSQTSIIAACIAVGFVVYITTKGELPKYAAVFTGSAKQNSTSATGSALLSAFKAAW